MGWVCGLVVGVAVIGLIAVVVQHQRELLALFGKIEQKRQELGPKVQLWFLVQPCSRCHEFTMKLLAISPNGRSVHYQCLHCKKKMHAAAGTPLAPQVIDLWNELYGLVGGTTSRSANTRVTVRRAGL
jgi:hypothetical protein